MLNTSKIEEISNKCLESTDKAISYLMKVTRKNGVVNFFQGDTKDIGIYSMLFNILPFTQGFCIRVINLYKISKDSNDRIIKKKHVLIPDNIPIKYL